MQIKMIFEKINELEKLFVFYSKIYNEQYTVGNSLPITMRFSYFALMNQENINEIKYLIKTGIMSMCDDGDYASAFELMKTLLADKDKLIYELWIDREITILYIFLHISTKEISMQKEPILSKFNTINSIKECYYQLKFSLRRMQYSLPDSLEKECYIKNNNISDVALRILAFEYMNIEKEGEFTAKMETLFHHSMNLATNKVKEECDIPAVVDSSHTFSFIICVKDTFYFDEIVQYIDNINIPKGYTIEIIPVYGAQSMTSGYNEGMNKAVGKYKIYLHQDVFLVNSDMLFEILKIFNEDASIGMIGVAGCDTFCQSGIWWDVPESVQRYAKLYQDKILYVTGSPKGVMESNYISVLLLDGVLMVTSKDVPWREDLFHGFHHYDVSQSLEFKRHGYQCVIPRQDKLWVLHDIEIGKSIDVSYDESRKRFLSEYSEEFSDKDFTKGHD